MVIFQLPTLISISLKKNYHLRVINFQTKIVMKMKFLSHIWQDLSSRFSLFISKLLVDIKHFIDKLLLDVKL